MTHECIDYKDKASFEARFPMDRRLAVESYPTYRTEMKPGAQLTIGDLHGNAALLLFHLVKWGKAIITPTQYKELYHCIQNTIVKLGDNSYTINEQLIQKFKEILSQIHFKSDFLLRPLGDETSDRGFNDYFTLLILQRLKECGVHIDILLSNHGLSFIHSYEVKDFTPRYIEEDTGSLSNLKILLDKKIISLQEVEDLINFSYKPTLKIITYSLNEEKDRITLYSHAPIGLNTIKSLCKKFVVIYRDKKIPDLIETIDLINFEFQGYVENNLVHTLYNIQGIAAISQLKHSKIIEEKELPTLLKRFEAFPVEVCTWNRVYHSEIIERPATHQDYKLCFVHGHDSHGPMLEHVHCLDSEFGKSIHGRGDYKILYSEESTIIPEEEIERRKAAIAPRATYDVAGAAGAAGADCIAEITEEQIQPIIEAVQPAKPSEPLETKPSETETQEAIKREAIRNFILNHEKFQQQEKELLAKAEKFTSTRYDTTKEAMREAFLAAGNLTANILAARQKLQKGGAIDDFHKEYKEAIEAAMPILKTHRGWKQSLLNILNCLVSLINCAIFKKENKFKFFITPTDSEKKAYVLKENLPVVINEAQLANP